MLPEWLLFCISPFPIFFAIPFLLEDAVTYLNIFRRLGHSLKEHEAAFMKGQNLLFSIAAGSISFFFVLHQIVLEVRFKFAVTMNLDIPF